MLVCEAGVIASLFVASNYVFYLCALGWRPQLRLRAAMLLTGGSHAIREQASDGHWAHSPRNWCDGAGNLHRFTKRYITDKPGGVVWSNYSIDSYVDHSRAGSNPTSSDHLRSTYRGD